MAQAKSVTDFRPDIEGLRAFAMLAILVYHLDVNALTGGFSAVDIFFPISGYLISKQIIEVKQFSFIGFTAAACAVSSFPSSSRCSAR